MRIVLFINRKYVAEMDISIILKYTWAGVSSGKLILTQFANWIVKCSDFIETNLCELL